MEGEVRPLRPELEIMLDVALEAQERRRKASQVKISRTLFGRYPVEFPTPSYKGREEAGSSKKDQTYQ